MAVIKCKMCGGDLALLPDSSVCQCEYCGTKQTVPYADNEKKLNMFTRANRLRAGCEFDKASGVFESIVAEFPEEAEAYWGLVLCKYGIEYVDDPGTGKKIPTCHRTSFESVMEDPNLELTLEYADATAHRVYRQEAKQIEEIRRGIIEVSAKEEPYDVFICYKETGADGQRTLDSVLAQDIYTALTREGHRAFFSRITLEDKLGVEYEPYIFAALNSARVMLVVGTDYDHFNAVWVKNEWSRFLKLMASDHTKHLIPCYKDIDAYDMPKEFAKLQAQDLGKLGAIQDIVRGVEKLVNTAPKPQTLQSKDVDRAFILHMAREKGKENTIPALEDAVDKLKSLGDLQEARELLPPIERKLKKLKRRRNLKRTVILGVLGAMFCAVAAVGISKLEEVYDRATRQMEYQQYYHAARQFGRFPWYRNSGKLAKQCEEAQEEAAKAYTSAFVPTVDGTLQELRYSGRGADGSFVLTIRGFAGRDGAGWYLEAEGNPKLGRMLYPSGESGNVGNWSAMGSFMYDVDEQIFLVYDYSLGYNVGDQTNYDPQVLATAKIGSKGTLTLKCSDGQVFQLSLQGFQMYNEEKSEITNYLVDGAGNWFDLTGSDADWGVVCPHCGFDSATYADSEDIYEMRDPYHPWELDQYYGVNCRACNEYFLITECVVNVIE